MAFCWQADPTSPHQLKKIEKNEKKNVKVGLPLTKLSGFAHGVDAANVPARLYKHAGEA